MDSSSNNNREQPPMYYFHRPHLSIPNPTNPNPTPNSNNSPFKIESSQPSVQEPPPEEEEEPPKRKRGRPRKQQDADVSLSDPGSKRGRGRPPGSGKKQQLASLGGWVLGSAGMGFTPHIITISVGEDIAAKIMSFSQQGPRAVCILSANGSVSTVTLRQPATSGGTVTYEGRFEILCLSGSYLLNDDGGPHNRSGGLSVSLSSPDGRVIGGGVGLLIAASPVQVIVGSFIYGASKSKNKTKAGQDAAGDSELLQTSDEQIISPCNTLSSQSHSPSALMGGWSGPGQMDMRNAHLDIDLTRG